MSEYWKSTPRYWCKFCKDYVRDTPLERRNHEASGKHQGSIQRSLRELHKSTEAAARDQQRAKDEVARLNGLVGGSRGTAASGKSGAQILGVKNLGAAASTAPAAPLSAAAQRKAHAEQLAALGVQLPAELKKEVTGIGGWQTVSERAIQEPSDEQSGGLAPSAIKKNEDEVKSEVQKDSESLRQQGLDGSLNAHNTGLHTDTAATKRNVWGSSVKTYPGNEKADDGGEDLDTLLGGLKRKSNITVKNEEATEQSVPVEELKNDPGTNIKGEQDGEESKLAEVPPTVVFKKRKVKR